MVVNPWVREDVTLNREHLPWIPGDRHVPNGESNDAVEDVVETEGQVAIVPQGDDMEADSAILEGEGTQLGDTQLHITQLDHTQQNTNEDDSMNDGDTQPENAQVNGPEQQIEDDESALSSIERTVAEQEPALQNAEQSVVETDADPLPETKGVKSNYNTRSKSVKKNADVIMEDVSEQDAPEEDTPEQYDPSQDHPGRIYCICNDTVGGTMVLCDNHRDNDVSCYHECFPSLFTDEKVKVQRKVVPS